MTMEVDSNGFDRKTAEKNHHPGSGTDAGQSTELDAGPGPAVADKGPGPSLAGSPPPPWVSSDGIRRIDARRFLGNTAYGPAWGAAPLPVFPSPSVQPWQPTGANSSEPLPECSQETSIRAWKRVTIQDFAFAPKVISRYSKKPLVPLEVAKCMALWGISDEYDHRRHHTAPFPTCTCGFYGWKKRKFEDHQQPRTARQYAESGTSWQPWAEVDFYGQVIEHEYGYRAERQRILAIHLGSPFLRIRDHIPANMTLADIAKAINIPIIDLEGVEHK